MAGAISAYAQDAPAGEKLKQLPPGKHPWDDTLQGRTRPKILGIAHAAFYVSDLAKTRVPDGTRIEVMETGTFDGKPVAPVALP